MERTPAAAGAGSILENAAGDVGRAFDGLDDIEHRDVLERNGRGVPAGSTRLGPHPPLVHHRGHGLRQEPWRRVEGLGQVGGLPASAPRQRDQGTGGEVRALAEIELEMIQLAIARYRGQMSEVARRLGIGRSTLYRKLKEYGIDPEEGRSERWAS